jgi:hypothetical protein
MRRGYYEYAEGSKPGWAGAWNAVGGNLARDDWDDFGIGVPGSQKYNIGHILSL